MFENSSDSDNTPVAEVTACFNAVASVALHPHSDPCIDFPASGLVRRQPNGLCPLAPYVLPHFR